MLKNSLPPKCNKNKKTIHPANYAGKQYLGLFHFQVIFEVLQALFLTLIRKQLAYVYEVEQWYINALGCVLDEVRCLQEGNWV